MRRFAVKSLVAALLLCAVLFGNAALVYGAPVKGGVLKIAATITPTTFLFHQVRAVHEIAHASLVQETLMRYDEKGVPQPFLLEAVEGMPEQNIWRLKVRKGVKFHDGSDLNAEAVAWNLNIYKEKGIFSASFYAAMDRAEVVDEYTVDVHMNTWDSLFPYTLARSCLIASKQAFDTYGEDYLKTNPVGTGPFILKEYEPDVREFYVKNPNYWQGEPYLDGVEFIVYENELVMQGAMEIGELHGMVTSNYQLASDMARSRVGYTINGAAVPTSAYTLCFNMSDPTDPFADELVRRAVSYAINAEEIADALLYGYGVKSNQWCVPQSEFFNTELEGQPYNIQKAKQLLAEAGYPNGFKTILTTQSQTLLTDICQVIAEQLSDIGIEVEIRPILGAGYVNYIGGWEKGMLLHPMGMENGAASQISVTFVQGLDFALGVNSFIHPDDLHQMINQALVSDEATSVKMFRDIQKVIFDDYCFMKTIAIGPNIGIMRPEVKGHDWCKVQNAMHSFHTTYIEK
ncbi:MAG: ABC transporter substrate-binding protein [Firmicutes bacterium]|jgi:peptide/nickel transport system substrate-binding protein/glutathione transport system substrate-binding protein|nr:ABC transporter substrate-binding protein [Bacillota bacterium]NLL87752.1 ABC transporter substrate-binding protein [Bacillota bacterium]